MKTSAAARPRALITQNHMVDLAGSEVLTLELAEELRRRDYEVAVFSHVVGDPISGLARERGIALTDDVGALDDPRLDLAWIHHQVIPVSLGHAAGKTRPTVVFGHMSPFEPLELPLFADIEARLADIVVANSLETGDVLRAFGLGDVPLVILGNPAPDAFWNVPRSRPQTLKRLLIVSNHLPAEVRVAMERLAAEGLTVDHVGVSGRVAPVTPELVAAADAVLAIGKSVQYALAVGRPVFCYDVHGGPGWLAANDLALTRAHNFSGRPFARMKAEDIVRAILGGFEQACSDVDLLRAGVADLTWSRGLQMVLGDAPGSRRERFPLGEVDRRRIGAHFALAGRAAREHRALAVLGATEQAAAQALRAVADLTTRVEEQQHDMRVVVGSTSWRATAPLRRSAERMRQGRRSILSWAQRRQAPYPVPEVCRVDSLPALAWLCHLSKGPARLLVGPQVEVSAAGISEGSWVGPFRHECLSASPAVFGSGVVFADDGLLFVPPSHPLEALFLLEDLSSGESYVSNSMCFALSRVPRHAYSQFCTSLNVSLRQVVDRATAAGVDARAAMLHSAGGYRLSRLPFFRFRVAGAGPAVVVDGEDTPFFGDFCAYRGFLSRSLAELFANAGDRARAHRLRPLVALSRGYDSTAVAVLATQNGCEDAATIDVVVNGRADSGEAIARKLGLNIISRAHVMGGCIDDLNTDFGRRLATQSTEFLATEGLGDDVIFLPFEPELHDGMLLTGAWGDTVWAKDADVGSGLPVRTPFGKSITEFRLRVGFAHVPVPFIGGRAADSIGWISRSSEMADFSVGGAYDRPIPRRIGEEAGLARSAFGSEKVATAPLPMNGAEYFVDALSAVRDRYVSAGC